jgi:hypothetical protein
LRIHSELSMLPRNKAFVFLSEAQRLHAMHPGAPFFEISRLGAAHQHSR